MTTMLSSIGVAFCIWLAVRLFNRRERWAKWTLTVVIALPAFYVLSFGPACWWWSDSIEPKWMPERGRVPVRVVPAAYLPIVRTARNGPLPLKLAIRWYATLRAELVFWGPTDWNGSFPDGIIFSRKPNRAF
jgi:hypothetical protein